MLTNTDLFGLTEIINVPKKRSVCGCFIPDCHCIKIKAIENHFKAGKELTVLDAVKLFKTIDARKFISILRQRGMNIVGTWVFEEKVKYKRYKLVRDEKNTA